VISHAAPSLSGCSRSTPPVARTAVNGFASSSRSDAQTRLQRGGVAGTNANRVAYSALKHTHEKVGDHWEPKEQNGPSDKQTEGGKNTNRKTAGGVDANASKKHLQDLARRLDVSGRSSMTKDELVGAIEKANDRESAKSRKS